MRASLFVFCLIAARAWAVDFTPAIPANCREAVLVTGRDWSATTGTLQRFERPDGHTPWHPIGTSMNALLGKHGLAWGVGVRTSPKDNAPHKKEGDLCAPAGVFAFGTAFGRLARADVPWLRMPYQLLSPTTEAIDDPASRFYNRLVDRARIAQPDWHSSEHMGRVPAYELGIFVDYNPACVPGAGSCIFLHLWTGDRIGTSGCTVLHREDLVELLHWLDPAKHPMLIQLPEPIVRASLKGF